jgi:hypothetical protein
MKQSGIESHEHTQLWASASWYTSLWKFSLKKENPATAKKFQDATPKEPRENIATLTEYPLIISNLEICKCRRTPVQQK